MRAFAQKPEPFQQTRPAPSTLSARVRPEPEILGLQGTIGNRAVQRRLHLDAGGGEQQEERSAALARGLDPDAPGNKPADPLDEALREAALNPQPREPESTLPGDPIQQAHTVANVDPADLWLLPRIQERMQVLAAETEARERAALKPGDTAKRTAANLMAYWHQPFIDSVDYILYRRDGGRRARLLKELRAEEARLVKSFPAVRPGSSRSPDSAEQKDREMRRHSELVSRVEALRRSYGERWQQTVDRTADRFVILASNQARFATIQQKATPVRIYGLPEGLEPMVGVGTRPDILAKDSTPVAESVIKFIEAVRDKSKLNVMAGNYKDHEKHSPYLGNAEDVGKYSFDVDLGALIKVNEEGFYEREPLTRFFLAVDEAAKKTGIGWIALYNDFEVAKTVNEKLGQVRIGFSGARAEGSIHHGPAPYLLHIHFNIMPAALAGQLTAGKILPQIDLSYMQ